ncbi:hypothetical protein D3869_26675 (plasmid) [Azospirillum brasilense]|uniref:Tip attachment protein J domain-containing protein n=1 Tax=Azospirillum brasilense TaxID=192 RepID=A0A4D8R677_AZOBR|nr:hypothetical protein [Azospirillum brasilense]QCO18855.1 hypothetical protein D3869_26675 [Azospirillum brasilense]
MANALFGFGNLIDLPTTVLSCGSQRSNLPVSNLADPDPQRPWVTAGTTRDWAAADFGTAQPIRLLGLFGALLTSSALVRWRVGNSTPLAEAVPILDCDFTAGGLDPRISFSRAGTATYLAADGLLKTAAVNVPRFAYRYDAATSAMVALGLQLEPVGANLVPWSQDLDKWGDPLGNTTVTVNVATAPDGTLTADRLASAVTGADRLRRWNVAIPNDTLSRVLSVWGHVDAGRYLNVGIAYNTGGTSKLSLATADFQTGTVVLSQGVNEGIGIEPWPGGWYRVWVPLANNGTGNTVATLDLRPFNHPNAGQAAGAVLVWGVQYEPGTVPGSAVPTNGTAATRAADVATLALASVPGWNPAACTLVCEFNPPGRPANPASNGGPVQIDRGDNGRRLQLRLSDGVGLRGLVQMDGDTYWAGSYAFTAGERVVAALAVANGDAALAAAGTLWGTVAAPVLSGLNRLWLGSEDYSGTIARVTLYAQRLTNAQAVARTGPDRTTAVGDVYDSGWVAAGVAPGYWATLRLLDAPVVGRYARVDISDPARATQTVNGQAPGDLITGRLWASGVIQPMRNISYPIKERPVPMDTKQRGKRSGAVSVDPGATYREISFGYEALGQEDARGPFKEFLRRIGVREQIVFIPEPGGAYQSTEAILGRQAESTPLTWAQFAQWSHSMTIEEDPALGA